MLKKKLRIIIDSNLWVSYFISKNLNGFDGLLAAKNIDILISDDLLLELSRVFRKPKLQTYLRNVELHSIVRNIEDIGSLINVTSSVNICRDPMDDYLLALARDGEADYLVTGDKDLLILQQLKKQEL